MTIGENIRALRRQHALTQVQLAKAARVAQGDLSLYETGKMVPGQVVAGRIYQAMGEEYDPSATVDWRCSGLTELDALTRVQPIDWHVRDFLAKGTITLLAGEPGAGKTAVAQNLAVTAALAKANGLRRGDCAGYEVKPATVLMVDAENGPNLIRTRLQAMGLTKGASSYCRTVLGEQFDLCESIPSCRSLLREVRPDWLVLDSFTSLWTGSPASPTKARVFFSTLRSLAADFACGVLLIHHTTKDASTYRGSGVVGQSIDGAIFLLRKGEGDLRFMVCDKMRLAPEPDLRAFQLTNHGLRPLMADPANGPPEPPKGKSTEGAIATITAIRRAGA